MDTDKNCSAVVAVTYTQCQHFNIVTEKPTNNNNIPTLVHLSIHLKKKKLCFFNIMIPMPLKPLPTLEPVSITPLAKTQAV